MQVQKRKALRPATAAACLPASFHACMHSSSHSGGKLVGPTWTTCQPLHVVLHTFMHGSLPAFSTLASILASFHSCMHAGVANAVLATSGPPCGGGYVPDCLKQCHQPSIPASLPARIHACPQAKQRAFMHECTLWRTPRGQTNLVAIRRCHRSRP
jgi:hypothetical protein